MSTESFRVDRDALTVVMEHTLPAPSQAVFDAHVDPAAIPRWWGPRSTTTSVEQLDACPGGAWRFVCCGDDGVEHAFHGRFVEVARPDRIRWTFNYEGFPGDHEVTETVLFDDLGDGTTRLTATSVYQHLDDLDAMVGSGMEGGARESWERLSELVSA